MQEFSTTKNCHVFMDRFLSYWALWFIYKKVFTLTFSYNAVQRQIFNQDTSQCNQQCNNCSLCQLTHKQLDQGNCHLCPHLLWSISYSTHTHPFNGPFSGTTRVGRYQKGKKPIWILLKQETVSGNGISWAICKSASRSRQITTPAPHHSSFLQAWCPSCRPTNSVKALKAIFHTALTQ